MIFYFPIDLKIERIKLNSDQNIVKKKKERKKMPYEYK